MNNIGIIGAGVMGKGVAHRFAKYGKNITLFDSNKEILDNAKSFIGRDLRLKSMFDRTIKPNEILENITVAYDINEMKHCEFIIENISEIEDEKKKIYKIIGNIVNPECVILANTSCIPITRLGLYSGHPENVIGVHFMNPVPQKDFAEVIIGKKTSEATIKKIESLLESVNISFEAVRDSAGFVSNRLSHLFMNEAAFLVYEHIASPEQIDNIFKRGFSHQMGPLETADLIGIDTVVDSLQVLYKEYQDPKYRVCPLLLRMLESGELGRKTSKGFYKY